MDRIYSDKLKDNYLAFALQSIENYPYLRSKYQHNIKSLHDIKDLKDYKGKR